MKYVNNGNSQNIIKDSDVNMSESFQNQNLAQVLTNYRRDLDTLKSNVKWLAKYGGVGGSGGGGSDSSNVKLKYKVDVRYTNNAGIQTSESFASKTSSGNIIAQPGSRATISVTLLRCMPNTDYQVKILYGEEQYSLRVNSLTLTVSQNVTCVGNSPVNILVYATPEDMPETVINFYTVAKSASLNLQLNSGAIISNGNTVLTSYVQDVRTKIVGTLTNYLPSMYSGHFIALTVNGVEVSIQTEDSLGNSGETILQFEVPVKNVFNNFGIYEVQLRYEYNGVEEFIKNVYIYKDIPVFVYCYGETNTVYATTNSSPSTSNYSVETIKYRIYPEEGYPSNQEYSISYVIEYEGKPEATLPSQIFYKESNKDWEIKFQNVYSKNDFTSKDQFKQVTITFEVGEHSFKYYVYIKQMDDISYLFTNTYKNGNTEISELFYNAEHSCTATLNEDSNPNVDFPFENGVFKKLLKDETYPIKHLASKTSLTTATSVYGVKEGDKLVGGYVTNYNPESSATDPDILLSFGLKYEEYNLDLPIVTINITDTSFITLYSNKIVYGNNTYTRWFIPNDGKYHLIQLYYKPRYSIDVSNCVEKAPDNSSAFMWCVDGVMETQPIYINKAISLITFSDKLSSITYHPGNWDFNFIGLASFNAKPNPSIWESNKSNIKLEVLKYALDFDPIIPANYYQAYYQFVNRESMSKTFDQGVYTNLFSNNENNKFGINYYKTFNKFVAADIVAISKLTDLPIYIIDPVAKNAKESVAGKEINDFLHKTYAGGYNETSTPLGTECAFKRINVVGEELREEYLVNDTKYKFYIEYQGSSTLKYGAKNFEISALEYSEGDEINKTILWTPDENIFLPEKSFTLKADIVDSSHSNNVIVGKFVNDYMKSSAFNENCKTCLEGFPILLFMRDVVEGTSTSIPSNPIFLGIYSFNLGRKSMYNLGYKNLNIDKCTDISVSNSSARAFMLDTDDAISYPYKYRVAEVQGNSPSLYDYSQYDYMLLGNKMLGDFFNYDGASENTNFSSDFQRPFIGLNKLVFHNFVKDLNDNYTPYTFKEDELWGYYSPKNSASLFNVLQINFDYKNAYPVLDTYYYRSGTTPIKVPSDGLILDVNQIEGIKPYLSQANNLSIIGNPLYQFHLICNNAGEPSSSGFYYVEKLQNNPTDFDSTADDYFEYESLLRYYIICMLFAMVDSVQKNLTLRCVDFNPNTSNAWRVGFYDMDTSFGVDNIGNPVDFKAFSDYILQSGKVVSDYFDGASETSEGSGFDVPSSFLFLVAKYLNILTQDGVNTALGERTFINHNNANVLKTPFNYWQELRGDENLLKNVDVFFAKYVDNHFKDVNPLIWNLNYMYKYFSASGTTGNDTDTEQSKFNGTRRYSRKNWLKQRLEVIDVLFGIRNNHTIGNSDSQYICKQQASDNVTEQQNYSGFLDSVPIATTMFPTFKKGIGEVDINAEATSYPKAPVVLQTTNSDYKLYLADNTGKIDGIKGHVTSNVDIGFYGTINLKTLNECGQFLWDTINTNNIVNNTIQNIVIDKYPSNGKQSINLDLENLSSVNQINVNQEGSIAKVYKGNQFVITTNKERVIDSIVFKHCKFSDTLAITGNGANLTIKNLTITDCECATLTLKGVKVQNLTLKNCKIKKYELSGEFPNLSLSDGYAESAEIIITNNQINITLSMASLKSLTIQGSIRQFTLSGGASGCQEVSIKDLQCPQTTLLLNGLTNYNKDLLINLTKNVTQLTLQCANNTKCTGYRIAQVSKSLSKVILKSEAFKNNHELQYIYFGTNDQATTTLINQTEINIEGDSTFYACYKLPGNHCIPTGSKAFKLLGNSHKNMYSGNGNLSISHVVNFFDKTKLEQTNVDLSYLFNGCKQIQFTLGTSLTKPSAYDALVDKLTTFIKNKTCNFTNAFAETKFNFLDGNLVKLFKYKSELPDICPSCIIENDRFIYVTDDFLSANPEITKITLGNRFGHLGYVLGETLTKVVKLQDESYVIDESVDINGLFNNGSLEEIAGIHLYTSDEVSVDCSKGLPSYIKRLKFFNTVFGEYNFNQIEKLFDNVQNCEVYMDIFFGGNKINVDNKINIFDLFWRKVEENGANKAKAKVILKLHESSKLMSTKETCTMPIRGASSICYSLNFDKTCTKEQFKLIMQYLVDLQIDYLNSGNVPQCAVYNQIPGLFQNCTITGVNDFKDLITAEDGKSYFTVRINVQDGSVIRDVSFIDLERTFSHCSLKTASDEPVSFIPELLWEECKISEDSDDIYKAKVINLKLTFQGTYQQKIRYPFNIRWVQSMYQCFINCTYESIAWESSTVVNNSPAGNSNFKVTWSWLDNFPILPANFFSGFYNCNVTQCFFNANISQTNLQGQLPRTKEELWWKDGEVNLSTVGDMFKNALIHPMKQTIQGENETIVHYYIYPKAYTDVFSSSDSMYQHVIIPLQGNVDSNATLFLFESIDTLLNFKPRLPQLPDNNGTTWYSEFLGSKTWKVRINKSDTFMNDSSLMSSYDYKQILPASLFLVLNNIHFNTYNLANSKPILLDEGYGYYNDGSIWKAGTTTPGGISEGSLDSALKTILR